MEYQTRLLWKCFFGSCVLLVFVALMYDFPRSSFNFHTRFFNKNTSIEQALEQIPICTPFDRSRQRTLLYTFQAWTEFAREHNIRYWITYGTLVGYVQRRGLLPHDLDIDVAIMAYDTSHLFELSKSSVSSTYELRVHPQWYLVGYANRSYFYSEHVNFVAPNARFVHSRSHHHVDIYPIYDFDPDQKRLEKNSTAMLTEYDNSYAWRSAPKDWTFPLRECRFSGIKVWCPAQPEKLVTNMYGELSLNISYNKCVNGSWTNSDDYARAEKMLQMKKNNINIKKAK